MDVVVRHLLSLTFSVLYTEYLCSKNQKCYQKKGGDTFRLSLPALHRAECCGKQEHDHWHWTCAEAPFARKFVRWLSSSGGLLETSRLFEIISEFPYFIWKQFCCHCTEFELQNCFQIVSFQNGKKEGLGILIPRTSRPPLCIMCEFLVLARRPQSCFWNLKHHKSNIQIVPTKFYTSAAVG